MTLPKIVIAGGSGFIGAYLADQFSKSGYEVLIISRGNPYIRWDDEAAVVKALEGAVVLINLAGKSVNCRYTEDNKKEIFRSRTETTKILGKAIRLCKQPPELWINSSTATIYRYAEDRPMTELDGEIGQGFSVEVAKAWEQAFFEFEDLPVTRLVALRIAIVLGAGGGVIGPYTNLVRYGLGGRQGSGNQMFSWIHIEDLYRVILFIQADKSKKGIYNCSAPGPVSNTTLMHSLQKVMHRPFGLPAPTWLLKLGAIMIKTETELVLKSRWVIPQRLLEEGFVFEYPGLEPALQAILNR
jgi:uncharacterized protein (TIGR01777 family)